MFACDLQAKEAGIVDVASCLTSRPHHRNHAFVTTPQQLSCFCYLDVYLERSNRTETDVYLHSVGLPKTSGTKRYVKEGDPARHYRIKNGHIRGIDSSWGMSRPVQQGTVSITTYIDQCITCSSWILAVIQNQLYIDLLGGALCSHVFGTPNRPGPWIQGVLWN